MTEPGPGAVADAGRRISNRLPPRVACLPCPQASEDGRCASQPAGRSPARACAKELVSQAGMVSRRLAGTAPRWTLEDEHPFAHRLRLFCTIQLRLAWSRASSTPSGSPVGPCVLLVGGLPSWISVRTESRWPMPRRPTRRPVSSHIHGRRIVAVDVAARASHTLRSAQPNIISEREEHRSLEREWVGVVEHDEAAEPEECRQATKPPPRPPSIRSPSLARTYRVVGPRRLSCRDG